MYGDKLLLKTGLIQYFQNIVLQKLLTVTLYRPHFVPKGEQLDPIIFRVLLLQDRIPFKTVEQSWIL